MRWMSYCILFACLQVSARGYGQKVSLDIKRAPLQQVMQQIEKQTSLKFVYSSEDIRGREIKNFRVQSMEVNKLLELLSEKAGLHFLLENTFIIIRPPQPEKKNQAVPLETAAPGDLHGRVTDSLGNPLAGATVMVRDTRKSAVTNSAGEFTLPGMDRNTILVISSIGYETREYRWRGEKNISISLQLTAKDLEQVEVTLNTGYQKLPKERATGSFTLINNELLNRSVSTDVLSRLDGVTSGLTFNKLRNRTGYAGQGGDPAISIRGRSTLFANTDPLIVLDNFPYEGDLTNINPNDIESVTVLKDAAAASIWGVRAGNGVIVLTSKKGKINQPPKVSLNSNVTITGKPDLYSVPQLTPAHAIEVEKYWFDNGKYNAYLNIPRPYFSSYALTPVVEILNKKKKGILSAQDADGQLADLAKTDSRDDYTKYFLRNTVNQQYALNIAGGSDNHQYYFSGGYDRNLNSKVSDSYQRLNLTANNTYKFLKDRVLVSSNMYFTKSKNRTNPSPWNILYPYEKVVDANGNALPEIVEFRQSAKDAFLNKGLLNWNYYPFKERFNNNNITDLTDFRISLRLNVNIIPEMLDFNADYQFQQGRSEQVITRDTSVYTTRSLINKFAQINPTGTNVFPVPIGAIINSNNSNYTNNAGRFQLNYHQTFGSRHEIVALAGTEVKDYSSFQHSTGIYGYNAATATSVIVDYLTDYSTAINGGSTRISNYDGQSGSSDRSYSYFANASYTMDGKYILSASARKDESNLFGVDANKKGVPLYSAGLAWNLSKEHFFSSRVISLLKWRITNGYNGNLTKNLSAWTTSKVWGFPNIYNVPQQTIVNPPNPLLSWERVHIINTGFDVGIKNDRITGSIDFFYKKGEGLIGNSLVAPQTGNIQFTGNTASVLTKGVEISMSTVNLTGKFQWTTNFLFNYTRDKVTEYKMLQGTNDNYVSGNYQNPLVGKPYSALFAFPWAGLDTAGNPQGYLDGKATTNYAAILNDADVRHLKYIGPAIPAIFGNLRNNFQYRQLALSFNLSYKFGYYFRRSIYRSSFWYATQPDADYVNRWKSAGDEKRTNVPAQIYPGDGMRDRFYSESEIPVEKGDHIRLQDIRVCYQLPGTHTNRLIRNLSFFAYASNLCIIWRANKRGLDPDYSGGGTSIPPAPRSVSLGCTATF